MSVLAAAARSAALPSLLAATVSLTAAAFLAACAGTKPGASQVVAPDDMPDICQDLDFNRDVEFREMCGVKSRDYMAYKNIPEHRNLILPKGGRIVKKGKAMELRLPNTLPAALPGELAGKIVFDEKLRRTFLKSRMDYCEFFPEEGTHSVKIFKLDIPQDVGGEFTVCYTVESRPSTAQRKTGFASRLEPLDCIDFQRLKAKSMVQEPALEDSVQTTEIPVPQGSPETNPSEN